MVKGSLISGALLLMLVACGSVDSSTKDSSGATDPVDELATTPSDTTTTPTPTTTSNPIPTPTSAPPGTWLQWTTGTSTDFLAIDWSDPIHGWIVGTDQAILRTTDGGAHFLFEQPSGSFYRATVDTPLKPRVISPWPAFGTYHLTDVHAVNSSVVWMSAAGPLQAAGTAVTADNLNALFLSTNGGSSWTRVSLSTTFQVWGVFGFNASEARAASVAASSLPESDVHYVTGTIDQMRLGMQQLALHDITFADTALGVAVGDGIFRTQTSGASWAFTKAPVGRYWAVTLVDYNVGYAVGDGGLIAKTQDGGQNWTLQATPTTENLFGVSFSDVDRGWAVGNSGTVLFTIDGGKNWTEEYAGVSENLYDVYAQGASQIWAVGANGTLIERR